MEIADSATGGHAAGVYVEIFRRAAAVVTGRYHGLVMAKRFQLTAPLHQRVYAHGHGLHPLSLHVMMTATAGTGGAGCWASRSSRSTATRM